MFNLPFLLPQWLYRTLCTGRDSLYQTVNIPTSSNSAAFVEGSFSAFQQDLLKSLRSTGYGYESIAQAPPRSDLQAKRMARMMFKYLQAQEDHVLLIEDFRPIFPNETACRDAYKVFDRDGDGTITRAEFRGAVVRVFREQRNLSQSVANTGSALQILDTITSWFLTIGLLALLLALLGVKVASLLAVSVSVVLGLNFMLFDGANKTLNSLIFLFFMHPYDVGDRVSLNQDAPARDEHVLTVLHINIQNTLFRHWNGLEVSIANHILASTAIVNLSRNSEQWERIDFEVRLSDEKTDSPPSSPSSNIEKEPAAAVVSSNISQYLGPVEEDTRRLFELRRGIEEFLRTYPTDYYSQAFELKTALAADSAKGDSNLDLMRFTLKVRCRETVDPQKRWVRHARLISFIKQAVRLLGVDLAAEVSS